MTDRLHQFGANPGGRDFVVGDIHGCFDMLDALLAHIGFDEGRDRLFSVGDLIDRGPDSARSAEFLDAPWFYAIRGNHEQMLLDASARGPFSVRAGMARRLWHANGGDWFMRHSRGFRRAFAERIEALPYAMEVEMADGRVAALVHADVLNSSWPATRYVLTRGSIASDDKRISRLVWDRERAHALYGCLGGTSSATPIAVDDIDLIVFGHTPMDRPIACANTRWLDTGAVFGNRLSVAELVVNGKVWSLADDLQDCREGWQTC